MPRDLERIARAVLVYVLAAVMALGGVPVPALAEMSAEVSRGQQAASDFSVPDGIAEPTQAEEAMGEEPATAAGTTRDPAKRNEGELGTEPRGAEPTPPADELVEGTPGGEQPPAEDMPNADELAAEGFALVPQASGQSGVSAPRVRPDSSQVTTWDCVWLGSYPQTEVPETDALRNASWPDGDATVGGVRYRRVAKSDATDSYFWSGDGYGSAAYRYFRYEPIKWRVLKVDGDTALAVADVALDCRQYHKVDTDVTWETSTIRSWLNGTGTAPYYAKGAQSGRTAQAFAEVAFTEDQLGAVRESTIANANNTHNGTAGGNDTTDRVFLLSEAEVHGASATAHGFVSSPHTYDEARRCRATDFARAMGVWVYTSDPYAGNCYWWLRSPGDYADYAVSVSRDGRVVRIGDNVDDYDDAVRPALNLNLSSPLVQPAGTVSSDGTINETAPTGTGEGGETDPPQPGTSFKITSAMATVEGKTTDLMAEPVTIDLKNTVLLNFSLAVQFEGDEVQGLTFELCQTDSSGKSKTIARAGSDGKFVGIRHSDLSVGATTHLRAYDAQGTLVASEQLWLEVVRTKDPSYIEIGKNTSIQIEAWPFNGAKVSLPSLKSPTSFYVDSDGKFRVAINVDVKALNEKFGSKWTGMSEKDKQKEAWRLLNHPDFIKNIVSDDGSMNTLLAEKQMEFDAVGNQFKPKFTVAGYLEGVQSGAGYKLAGQIALNFAVKWDQEFQEVVFVVPVVGAVTLKGSAALTAGFKVDFLTDDNVQDQWRNWEFKISPNVEAALGLYGGAGAAYVASVGAFGEGAIGFTATMEMKDLYNRSRLDDVYLKGRLGLAVRFVGNQYELTLVDSKKQYIYKNDESLGTDSDTGQLAGQGSSDIPRLISQQEGGSPIDRSYLGSESAWNGSVADGAECLRRSMYPASEVCMTNVADGQLMVFLDDDHDRGDSNRSMLMWSRYSSSAKTWSEPQPVWQDGTADFLPNLCPDGSGGAWVTWSNAREALRENLSLADTASRLDVSVAHFDSGSGSMVNPEFVTNNNGAFELSPRVGVGPDGPVVAWSENPLNDLFGLDGGRSICLAERSGGSWGVDRICEPTTRVTSVAVGRVGDDVSVAWSEDADGTTDTMEDSSVRYWRRNGGITNVENGNAFNPQFARAGNVPALTWCEGDAMMYTTDGTVAETGLAGIPQTSYSVSGDLLDGAAIAYVLYKGGKGNIYTRRGRVGEWSDSLALTSQDGVITSWSAGLEAGVPSAVYATTVGGADADGETSLCSTIGSTKSCAVVESAYCEDGTVHATIRNAGLLPLANATVHVREGETVAGSAAVDGTVAPGDERAVEIPLGSLADNEMHTFQVSVDPSSADSEPKVVEVNGMRLRTSMGHYLSSASEDFVATVSNEGGAEITDGVVTFYNFDNPDETLSTVALEPLGVGQSVDVKYEGGTSLHSRGVNGVGVRVESCGQVAATDVLPTWGLGFVSEDVPVGPTKTFPDVPADAWYAGVVGRAVQLGMFTGYADGRFGPNDKVTRGQVAVILHNMAGHPAPKGEVSDFPDVKSNAYYYNAVRWARSVGVVSGYANGRFGPDDPVTREQLAAMLSSYATRVAGKGAAGSADDYKAMKDASKVSGWAAGPVGWCFRNGILSGTREGTVNPQGNATRAEAAKMVVYLHKLL